MPIDPSIIGGLQQPKFESPVNALAKMLEVQGAQQQNQLGQAKLDEYTRTKERQNKLLGLVQALPATATDDDRIAMMKGGGYFDEADKLQTGMLARQKTGADVLESQTKADKGKNDIAIKRTEMIGQTLGSLQGVQGIQPQHVATALQHLADLGVVSPEQTQQAIAGIPQNAADIPAYLQQHKMAVMSSLDQMKFTDVDANTKANNVTSTANTAATNATSRANNASTNATTQRGQNMTDARTRETLATSKVPAGYRAKPDGSMSFIPGGPADPAAGGKAPTEFQGKSAAFGARAEQADKLITGLTGKYSPAAINSKQSVEGTWLVGGALGAATNKMALSDSDQRAEQAQRDFVNAVLRQESGAAIGASEFENAKKQYFPQPGDGAGVIAQKAANRKLAIKGFQNSAGKAAFSAPPDDADIDIHAQADAILKGK